MAGILCAAPLIPLTAIASAQPSSGTRSFPAAPPPDLPSRPYVLPPFHSRTLPNGLKVVVVRMQTAPLVTVRIAVPAGERLDPGDRPGLADATARLLTSGTDRYSSVQVQERAESLGGSIGTIASPDYSILEAGALAPRMGDLLDLIGDVLLKPTFSAQEVELDRSLSLQRLTVQQQSPAFLANRAFARHLFGAHPYAVVAPTPESIRAVTRDEIQAFQRSHYSPAGAVMVVVGDIDPDTALSAIERSLGSWKPTATQETPPPPPAPSSIGHIELIDRPGSVQSNIEWGELGIRRGDPRVYAFQVANAILGGSSGSRLFMDVREREGYAYDVRSTVDLHGLAGDFTESAQTRTDVTAPALQTMIADTRNLIDRGATAEELKAAKEYLAGSFVVRLATQNGLADQLVTVEAYGLPEDYLQTYRERIRAVTAVQVQEIVRHFIDPKTGIIVVVGDAARLREPLKAIAPVDETPQDAR